MRIPIVKIKTPKPGAEELEKALRPFGRDEKELPGLLGSLHPAFEPVTTIIVDSATMDALRPPAIDLWSNWAVEELVKWLRKLPNVRNPDDPAVLELLPGVLLEEQPWITVPELADKWDAPLEGLMRKIRRLRQTRSTVALGCCFRVEDKTSVLARALTSEDLASLGRVATAIDHERVAHRAGVLCRLPSAKHSSVAWPVLSRLAVPIWLHEQSHASRAQARPSEWSRDALSQWFEEALAQVEAYNACREGERGNYYFIFQESPSPPYPLPSCAEMMKRLARTQPLPYRIVLNLP